jgi:pyruvate/2-oxoglutarate dehydrogenase complex dihydrolipoamide acyltransferase (E2) component
VQSDLDFRVSGKVLERFVDAGQTVKRGQTLMRVDPADLKLAAHALQEAVAAARARQAAEEEGRYRALRGSGAISVSAYDQAEAALGRRGPARPHLVELDGPDGWNDDTGYVHEFIASKLSLPLDGYEYYLAGPPPMIQAAVRLLMVTARCRPARSISIA